jgi:hypothetical protein
MGLEPDKLFWLSQLLNTDFFKIFVIDLERMPQLYRKGGPRYRLTHAKDVQPANFYRRPNRL